MDNQTALARKNLEKRLAPLRANWPVMPGRGWTRAIRQALGMTVRQFAARLGASPSRVPVIEKAEESGAVTLKTLREVAEALNCRFVYAFVPVKPLDEIVADQFQKKVDRDMARINHSMHLENRAVTKSDLADARGRGVEMSIPRGLWDET